MGGIGGSKGRKGNYPPGAGPLSRPSSVGDFNEVEEDTFNSISQMSDPEILQEFEKMLENMNLSEVRKTSAHNNPKLTISKEHFGLQTYAFELLLCPSILGRIFIMFVTL